MRVKSLPQADKILAAAAGLFASQRFHEARMDDVAALAEVGKGTVYRYFGDKEELYLSLLDRAAEGLQARLCRELRGVAAPRDRLLAVVRGLLGYFGEQPHVFDLIHHAEAMRRPGAEVPWQRTRERTVGLVRDIIRDGQRAGVFREADPEAAALLLLGGLRAVTRFGRQPRPEGFAEQVVEWFLGGLGEPRRGPASPREASNLPREQSETTYGRAAGTLVVRLDPHRLANPSADLRHRLPGLLAERSGGVIRGGGHDYVGDDFILVLSLKAASLGPALECVLDVINNVRLLGNDLRRAVAVAIEREGGHEVVYPAGFAGPFLPE